MNGNHAFATVLNLDPPTLPAAAQDKPGIDLEPGRAVADAAVAVCKAIALGYRHAGRLDPETRCEGGVKIAAVATLMLNHESGDDEFISKARGSARQILRLNFTDADDPAAVDAVIGLALDGVFEIVERVVKTERIYRLAWAN